MPCDRPFLVDVRSLPAHGVYVERTDAYAFVIIDPSIDYPAVLRLRELLSSDERREVQRAVLKRWLSEPWTADQSAASVS